MLAIPRRLALLVLALITLAVPVAASAQEPPAPSSPSGEPVSPEPLAPEPLAPEPSAPEPSTSPDEATEPSDPEPSTSPDEATEPSDPEPPAPEQPRDVVERAASATADLLGVLPLGRDEATCPADAIEIVWTPIDEADFRVGGFIEPLSPPTAKLPDQATGIARCAVSDHAVAGFDASYAGGEWTIEFPVPGHDEDEHGDEAGGPADRKLDAETLSEGVEAPTGLTTPLQSLRSTSLPSDPAWPRGLRVTPDSLASYDAQDTCSPTAKPGTTALAQLLERLYGNGGPYWVPRACSQGGTSEHKEGRALDWMLNPSSSAEVGAANDFTSWLLEDDPWGWQFGGARRMGVMYMIWDRRIWSASRAEQGWRDYTGWSPHTDHVHFSLSWAGARCQTTWWQATSCSGLATNAATTAIDLQAPPSAARADYDGDGFDDILWYRPGGASDPMWFGSARGPTSGPATSITGTYTPLNGDFDGDGRTDILWYGPGRRRDTRWNGTSDGTFRKAMSLKVTGTYRPAVGDFDGDGRDDVYWYGPGGAPDRLWFGRPDDGFASRGRNVGGTYDPVVGDFDGDGRDDILWYGPGSDVDRLSLGQRDRSFDTVRLDPIDSTGEPIPGDFDGDGRDDVFFYGRGAATDLLLSGRSNATFDRRTDIPIAGASYRPFGGDFDGDGHSDLFWYGPNDVVDWLYRGVPSGFAPTSMTVRGDYQPITSG